jgi:hypothetical protein
MRILFLATLLAATATPALAQSTTDPAAASKPLPYDRGYDKDTARTRAINDSGRPAVEDANNAVLAQSNEQLRSGGIDETKYAADVAAYNTALRQNRRIVAADEALYAERSRAYAQAMADWRAQVAACDRGHNRACRLPTPNPADYM